MLVGSFGLLSVDGEYWPWYAIMAVLAIVPAARVGAPWQRILGATFLIVSIGLVAMDVRAGKMYQERREQRLRSLRTVGTQAQAPEGRTNQ
jgi:hypothetical protein